MVFRHALDEDPRRLPGGLVRGGLVAEDNEVLQQIKEPLRLEHPLDKHLKSGAIAHDLTPLNRLPRRVVFERLGIATHRRRGAIGDHRHGVWHENRRDVVAVCLHLVPR